MVGAAAAWFGEVTGKLTVNKGRVIIQIYLLGAFPSAKSFHRLSHPPPSSTERQTPLQMEISFKNVCFLQKVTLSLFSKLLLCLHFKNNNNNQLKILLLPEGTFCSGKFCSPCE